MKIEKKLITPITIMSIITIVAIAGWLLEYSKVSSVEKEKNELNIQVENLNNQLQSCLVEKNQLNTEINQLNTEIGNNQKFLKMMEKGQDKLSYAWINEGYAKSDYDDASRNYYGDYYLVAKGYADSCDAYYGYAYNYFIEAKNFFEEAKRYASTNETLRLAELYVNFTELGAKLDSEMHQACEYFSSACNSYDQGFWETGNTQIEEMNEHIREHDKLVTTYNDYLSKIRALLDTL